MIGQTSDIHDRKVAEIALRDSERMFRALFEDTSVAVTIRDVATQTFIDCNSAALHLYGFRNREELYGTTPDQIAAPVQPDGRSAREILRAYVERAIRDGIARMEWIGRRRNGEDFPADVRTTVIALEDGRRVMQTMIEDVSVRRQAENTLRYRARRDELVSRVSRQFVQSGAEVALPFALEALGTFLGVSRVRMRRFSDDGAMLTTIEEWCAPGVPSYPLLQQDSQSGIVRWVQEEMARNGCLAIRDVEALSAEIRGLRRLPESPFRALLVVPMSDQEATTGWVVLDDVARPHSWSDEEISTARLIAEIIGMGRSRTEAETKLRGQAARNELLSGVSRLFLNDDPEVATDAALERLGAYFEAERASLFALDERSSRLRCTHRWIAPGSDTSFESLDAYPVPEGALVAVDAARSGAGGSTEGTTEAWFEGLQREAGRRNLHALVGYGGHVFGLLAVRTREGQGPKEDDAGILRIVGELIALGRVRRAAEIALEKAKEDAVAASRTKSAFLANMSHELRTPLNGVIGMVDLLATTALDERQRRYAEIARTSAKLLLSVISDILDFSKIEAGKLELESVEFTVGEIAQEVASILRLSAEEKQLVLSYHSGEGLDAPLLGDPSRLRQVLVNLVSNAIKFTRAGEVSVRASLVSESAEDARVRVEVRDTGVGIPVDAQAKLFQPFTQVDASTTREHGGTGLGLAICRELIERMRGTIGVASAPTEGSLFWFEVPLEKVRDRSSAPRAAAARAPSQAPKRQVAAHLLLVEDSPINAEVAAEIVRSAGYTFDLATDGATAIKAAKARAYDIVLMDCQLPEVDGYEASRRIRELERAGTLPAREGTLPIIALTASATKGDLEKCFAAGMSDHVSKPVDARRLLDVIARHLGGAPPPVAPRAGRSTSVTDLAGALGRLQGDRALLRRIASQFAEGAPAARAKLHEAVERRDAGAVAFGTHRLRGQASSFGGAALVEATEVLEVAARRENWTAAAAALLAVDAELDRLLRALAADVGGV
jgi:PAS domain S-box-containing protein